MLSIDNIGTRCSTGVNLVDRLAADALCGAVGRGQFGMLGFERAQLLDEPVVLEIGDRRRRFLVVPPIVLGDLAAKLGDALGGSLRHGRLVQLNGCRRADGQPADSPRSGNR